jgi:hypothetical protein
MVATIVPIPAVTPRIFAAHGAPAEQNPVNEYVPSDPGSDYTDPVVNYSPSDASYEGSGDTPF